MSATIIPFDDAVARALRAGDHMIRGTAADGFVRAFAITAKRTVQTAHENHGTSAVVTAALGRLMMGACMYAMMFKQPDELVTMIVRGDGPVRALTVTANCEGRVKGFPAYPHVWLPPKAPAKLDVGRAVGAGTLSVVRDLPGIEPYSSTVELVSGEIGDDLTRYFAVSDQVPTSVGLGVLVDADESVRSAGGFIVQLMPGCSDDIAARVEANVAGITSVTALLEEGHTPRTLLERVLDGLGFEELEAQAVEFYCGCNEDRAARATLILGPEELRDMVAQGEPAEVYCHFCGRRHYLSVERLQELLDASESDA